MIKHTVKSLLLFLAIVFQGAIGDKLAVLGVTPGFVLLTVLCLCTFARSYEGMIYAAFAGIILDCLWGNIFGLYTLLLLYTAVFCYVLNQHIYKKGYGMMCALAFLITLLYEVIFYVLYFGIWESGGSFWALFLRIILPQCAYNAILMIPVYFINRQLDGLLEGKRRWGDDE